MNEILIQESISKKSLFVHVIVQVLSSLKNTQRKISDFSIQTKIF